MRNKFFIVLWIILVILSMWLGSNVFPLLIDDGQLLGPPQLGAFHGPFRIIYWQFTLDLSDARSALNVAYAIIGAGILFSGVLLVYLYRPRKQPLKGIHGTSRWMQKKEIRKSGMLTAGGVILGQTREAKFQQAENEKWKMVSSGKLLFSNSPEHILVIAPTRRGKGINNVVPTLLSWHESCVVYDLKKENWDVTSGWRGKFSHVLRFEPTSSSSVKFNPLMEIEKGPKEVPQTQNICEMLADPFGVGKKDHWSISATALLTGVILHVLYTRDDKSLYGAYRALNDPEKPFIELIGEMLETDHPTIAETARNAMNKIIDEKEPSPELLSIISTASSYLSLYQDPIIAQNTASSDFRVADLVDGPRPLSLYLVVNPQDADRMRPLTRMIIQMIGKKLTNKGIGKKRHRLLFLIDEFPALGRLEFFETQLAFFAGYGIKCMIIAQSFSQLYKHYSRDTSIPSNCRVKIFLGADSPEEADILSKFLGKETMLQTTTSRSGKVSAMFLSGKSEAQSETGRYLMTSDEILRLPYDDIIISTGGTYPYKGRKIMYYVDARFQPRSGLPPPDAPELQQAYLPERIIPSWAQLGSTGAKETAPEDEPTPSTSTQKLERAPERFEEVSRDTTEAEPEEDLKVTVELPMQEHDGDLGVIPKLIY